MKCPEVVGNWASDMFKARTPIPPPQKKKLLFVAWKCKYTFTSDFEDYVSSRRFFILTHVKVILHFVIVFCYRLTLNMSSGIDNNYGFHRLLLTNNFFFLIESHENYKSAGNK